MIRMALLVPEGHNENSPVPPLRDWVCWRMGNKSRRDGQNGSRTRPDSRGTLASFRVRSPSRRIPRHPRPVIFEPHPARQHPPAVRSMRQARHIKPIKSPSGAMGTSDMSIAEI